MAKLKNTKTDASTAAYKMALAKLVERHRGLKLAMIADVMTMAAAIEPFSAEIEVMAMDAVDDMTQQ